MDKEPRSDKPERRLAVSSCLLGERVRYDGGHKRNGFVAATLGNYFELVPVCPEVAIGLGVPRAPIRLARIDGELRVIGVEDPALDVTDALADFGRQTAQRLADVCGYIFKSGSPSCGPAGVDIFSREGQLLDTGAGMFAREMTQQLPLLPVEDEMRLEDGALRDSFIERVFVYYRWQLFKRVGVSVAGLQNFHLTHRLAVDARDPQTCSRLDVLVDAARDANLRSTAQDYVAHLMDVLNTPATREGHVRVMSRILAGIEPGLAEADRQALQAALQDYRQGRCPRLVVMSLLDHHRRRAGLEPAVDIQAYLRPEADELMLRHGGA